MDLEQCESEGVKTRNELLRFLCAVYDPVSTLSEKNGKTALVMRNKTLGREMVTRSLPEELPVYDFLCLHRQKNLLEVRDVLKAGDGVIVLEEYIRGVSVAEVLKNGLYTYKGAAKVLLALCDALEILHENGFIHRDIKPGNVMISDEGVVKLVDFDASRQFDAGKERDTTHLGTVGYAAPEQYGVMQSGPRSDIYALGVLLNVMLTGCHPSRQLAPGKAGRIVVRCTQINPSLRFESVEELRKKL